MGALSPWHWAILIVVLVLLFGAKRLPDAARSLGKSMRIFKSEIKELNLESEPQAVTPAPPAAAAPTPVVSERVEAPADPETRSA